jgi:hypothetical protein
MLRIIALLTAFALALPSLAAAEEPHGGKPPPGKPAGRPPGPPPGGPHGPPPGGRPPGYVGRPGGPPGGHPPGYVGRPGGPAGGYAWRGHPWSPVHASPYFYPPGWGYRRWAVGAAIPAIFLTSAYFYSGYAAMGLPPPDPGFQWVRYGPDLLLVNVTTGEVVDTIYGAFY